MVCIPAPAVAGLNIPALTPVPLYVPPAGAPPVSAKAGALMQIAELAGQVTVGAAFTVMTKVQVLVQPVDREGVGDGVHAHASSSRIKYACAYACARVRTTAGGRLPVKAKAGSETVTAEFAGQVTTGKALTVMTKVQLPPLV